MKACTLCGAEYSERISFCFNDGEVLVAAGGGAVGVVNDVDVPSPRNVSPAAMPPTHTARTPVPGERRQRSIVQAQDGQMVPPPAEPEPDDFTPRPLQPLDVDPNEADGPATPMYTPPPGMDLDEIPIPGAGDPPPSLSDEDTQPTPVPPPADPAPRSAPPPPRPAAAPQVESSSSDARSSALLLMVAGIALAALVLFFIIILVVGAAGTGEEDQAELAEAIPDAVAEAPAPAPAVDGDPDDMDIPTPGPLDLGLPTEEPEPVVEPEPEPEPEPAAEAGGTETTGDEGLGQDAEGSETVAEAGTAPDPASEGTDGGGGVAVLEPVPEPAGEGGSPWGVVEPEGTTAGEQPAPAEPVPVLRSVAFSSSPSGAELIIDGEYRGNTPMTRQLPDGDYEVTVRLAGHVSQRQSLTVNEGVTAFKATLPKIEVAKLKVSAPGRDGDTLFVDGRPIGTLPREIELKPGSHTFTVEGPGGPRLTVTQDVTKADTLLQLQ